jgi:hypothetical protein
MRQLRDYGHISNGQSRYDYACHPHDHSTSPGVCPVGSYGQSRKDTDDLIWVAFGYHYGILHDYRKVALIVAWFS